MEKEDIDFCFKKLNLRLIPKLWAFKRCKIKKQFMEKEHRGYQKKTLHFGKCVDCGKEFSVAATDQNRVRCDKCQKEKRRETYRLSKQKSRNLKCPQAF